MIKLLTTMPLVVLEGLDGAGKSTHVRLLQGLLRERGFGCEYLHFPRFDAPVYGELIARFLRGELGSVESVDPYVAALLYAGDRADAGPMIRGWLDAGKFVILDRYVYSNVGFQCAKLTGEARESLRRWILDLEFGYNRLPRPDLSLFLDVPFEFTRRRLTEVRQGDDRDYLKGAEDIHEADLSLQERVRQVYLDSARCDPGLQVVDCSDGAGGMDAPERIFARIATKIAPLLERNVM